MANMLESDDMVSTGVFQPELADPELCNPFCCGLWELVPLISHYDVSVARAAMKLSKGDFSRNHG